MMVFANFEVFTSDPEEDLEPGRMKVSVPLDDVGPIEGHHPERCTLRTKSGTVYVVPVPRESLLRGLCQVYEAAQAAQQLRPGLVVPR